MWHNIFRVNIGIVLTGEACGNALNLMCTNGRLFTWLSSVIQTSALWTSSNERTFVMGRGYMSGSFIIQYTCMLWWVRSRALSNCFLLWRESVYRFFTCHVSVALWWRWNSLKFMHNRERDANSSDVIFSCMFLNRVLRVQVQTKISSTNYVWVGHHNYSMELNRFPVIITLPPRVRSMTLEHWKRLT